jgi:hypothetical protein
MNTLRKYLDSVGVANRMELANLLARHWYDFAGADETSMASHKLSRMANPTWQPPLLSFTIERHGATVLGSTRAEVQRWTLNLEEKTAHAALNNYRQLRPIAPRLDVQPLAEEIFRIMLDHGEDERLKWNDDGTIRVQIGKIIPSNGPKQTFEGRRKRFRASLEQLVRNAGGEVVRPNLYRLADDGRA